MIVSLHWLVVLIACASVVLIPSGLSPFPQGCTRESRSVISCRSIRTEQSYFAELAKAELGESMYKSHEELSVIGHPFRNQLKDRLFNFTYENRRYYFSRLKVLVLTNGLINSVADDTFLPFCHHLVMLDLSINRIDQIPLNALSPCAIKLQALNLSGNLIGIVHPIRGLRMLTVIDLSNNGIHTLDEMAFSKLHLTQLVRILLNKNYLHTIRSSSIDMFNEPQFANLSLAIHDNPLHCDCSLRWMATHQKKKGRSRPPAQSFFFDRVDPVCQSPSRLLGQSLSVVLPLDLVCEPVITKFTKSPLATSTASEAGHASSPTLVRIYEGDRLDLTCTVFADPRPRIWWTFKDSVTIGKTLVDQSDSGRYAINTSILDQAGFNISSTLTVDQVKLSDSGQIRCVAAFSPVGSLFPSSGGWSPNERNETAAEAFDLRVQPRHYHVRSSNLWIIMIVLVSIFLLVMVCVLVVLWARYAGQNSGRTKDNKVPSIDKHLSHIGLTMPKEDSSNQQVPVLDLGPPMYNLGAAAFDEPNFVQSPGTSRDRINSSPFIYLLSSPPKMQGNVQIDGGGLDVSAYDEEYRLLSDAPIIHRCSESPKRHEFLTSPLFMQPARPASSSQFTPQHNRLFISPGETEL